MLPTVRDDYRCPKQRAYVTCSARRRAHLQKGRLPSCRRPKCSLRGRIRNLQGLAN